MNRKFGPLSEIDLRNTEFLVNNTLINTFAPPVKREHGWLILWQKERKGKYLAVCSNNLSRLSERKVIARILKCLTLYGLDNDFHITNNVLESPKAWHIWSEAFNLYKQRCDT